jgi:hypothetical protein
MAPRRAALGFLIAAGGLAGCGGEDGRATQRFDLVTPPAVAGAPPLPSPSPTPTPLRSTSPARREPKPSQRDAERLKPVIVAWAREVRRGHARRAAAFFELPAIVAQSQIREISSKAEMEVFNATLPCGARLLEVQHDGRYVVGTFQLVTRRGFVCIADGQMVRVGFVFHGRRFSEWWEVPDTQGAKPGPPQRPEVP